MLKRQMTYNDVPVIIGMKIYSNGHDIDWIPEDPKVAIDIRIVEVTPLGSTKNIIETLDETQIEEIVQDVHESFRGHTYG